MRNIKEINFKNRRYYIFKDIINIKDFDSSLLKIDKMSYKKISICNIGYIYVLIMSRTHTRNTAQSFGQFG